MIIPAGSEQPPRKPVRLARAPKVHHDQLRGRLRGPSPDLRISTLFSCFASPMLPRNTRSAHDDTSKTTFASWTSPCLIPASFNALRTFRASAAHALTSGSRWTRGSINHRSLDPNPGRPRKVATDPQQPHMKRRARQPIHDNRPHARRAAGPGPRSHGRCRVTLRRQGLAVALALETFFASATRRPVRKATRELGYLRSPNLTCF